ncbi:MAG: hypothetical protein ABJA71_11320 [Ginsengibacter sp.]
MLSEYTLEMRYLICTLTVWRLTHLFVSEDGPWDFVYRLRKKLGNSIAGQAMDCFYCLSLWIATPFAMFISESWTTRLICWVSLSGGACLLEQLTGFRNNNNNNNNENKSDKE